MARRANRHLDRRPVRAPLLLLGCGGVALIVARVLTALAGGGDTGADVGNEGLVIASILYAVGGLCVLVGTVGLLSALVVHIVGRRERRS